MPDFSVPAFSVPKFGMTDLGMTDLILALHLGRPAWLLLLPAALLLLFFHQKRWRATEKWKGIVAPHLLEHLALRGGKAERIRPIHVAVVILILGGIAMAGFAITKEPPPFADDRAAVVVVIEASPSMNATDVQPSRLERAQQKVRDLLALRPGARTGLIAYAGDAHLILPLTDDAGILGMYADAVAPDVMPTAGDKPSEALALAQQLLEREHAAGSILFLTDGVPAGEQRAFAAHHEAGGAPLLFLAVGTDRGGRLGGGRTAAGLDRAGFETLERNADATVAFVKVDDADVRRLEGSAQRNLQRAQAEGGTWQWKEIGWWLVLPIVFLAGLWFRRGWTVRYGVFLIAALVAAASPAAAHESTWDDLWWTPDQQGRRHLERQEFEAAAAHFQDPMWHGVALYQAGDYAQAADVFASVPGPDGAYNLGNAYVRLERYEEAIRAYRETLEARQDDARALANLALAEELLEAKRKKDDEEEEPQEGGDELGADEVKVADPDDKKKRPEVEEEVTGGEADEASVEIWMRQVQTTPAAFLRAKFAYQKQAPQPLDARRKEDER